MSAITVTPRSGPGSKLARWATAIVGGLFALGLVLLVGWGVLLLVGLRGYPPPIELPGDYTTLTVRADGVALQIQNAANYCTSVDSAGQTTDCSAEARPILPDELWLGEAGDALLNPAMHATVTEDGTDLTIAITGSGNEGVALVLGNHAFDRLSVWATGTDGRGPVSIGQTCDAPIPVGSIDVRASGGYVYLQNPGPATRQISVSGNDSIVTVALPDLPYRIDSSAAFVATGGIASDTTAERSISVHVTGDSGNVQFVPFERPPC